MAGGAGKLVGIDLGTTFSAIAYLNDEGKPVTVPNREGGLITPSVVWLGDPRRVIVGPKAYQAAPDHPDQVIQIRHKSVSHCLHRWRQGLAHRWPTSPGLDPEKLGIVPS